MTIGNNQTVFKPIAEIGLMLLFVDNQEIALQTQILYTVSVDNFGDVLFASLDNKSLPKWSLL